MCYAILHEVLIVGFHVVCLSVGNHIVDRHFFINHLRSGQIRCSIGNPDYLDQPIFSCFDTAYNMKNICNNWEKKRNFKFEIGHQHVANFENLLEICTNEIGTPIKVAPHLNLVICCHLPQSKSVPKKLLGHVQWKVLSCPKVLVFYGEQ